MAGDICFDDQRIPLCALDVVRAYKPPANLPLIEDLLEGIDFLDKKATLHYVNNNVSRHLAPISSILVGTAFPRPALLRPSINW